MSIGQHLFSLFIVLVLLSTSSLMAQGQEIKQNLKGTRSLEVFVGPSLVYNHGSEEFDKYGKAKLAYHFGLNVRHCISNRFAISISLGFYRKGYKQEATAFFPPDIFNNPPSNDLPKEEVTIKSNLNNDYLLLHVLPQVGFFNNRFIIGVGGFYGQLIKSTYKREDILHGKVVRILKSNRLDDHESYDYGLSGFVGYDFNLIDLHSLCIRLGVDYSLPSYIIVDSVGIRPAKNLSYNLEFSFKIL